MPTYPAKPARRYWRSQEDLDDIHREYEAWREAIRATPVSASERKLLALVSDPVYRVVPPGLGNRSVRIDADHLRDRWGCAAPIWARAATLERLAIRGLVILPDPQWHHRSKGDPDRTPHVRAAVVDGYAEMELI